MKTGKKTLARPTTTPPVRLVDTGRSGGPRVTFAARPPAALRILLVEDSAADVALIKSMLRIWAGKPR